MYALDTCLLLLGVLQCIIENLDVMLSAPGRELDGRLNTLLEHS